MKLFLSTDLISRVADCVGVTTVDIRSIEPRMNAHVLDIETWNRRRFEIHYNEIARMR